MFAALVVLRLLPLVEPAAAAPAATGAAACPHAYERAQEERRAGRLISARRQLQACTQSSCPDFIVSDCRRWLDEVESGLPSVVFAARQNGRDLEMVSVFLDGRPLASRLDGRAVTVDPGKHQFSFVAPGVPRQTVEAVIAEGQKHRLISVDLPAAASSQPPVTGVPVLESGSERELPALPPTPSRAGRVATVGLALLGGVGVAAFAAFGLSGWQRERELRDTCSPLCSEGDERSVRRRYLAADLSLGTGLAALAVSGYLYQRSF